MNREEFSTFVATTIEDVIQFAEEKSGQKLPRTFAFQVQLGVIGCAVTQAAS